MQKQIFGIDVGYSDNKCITPEGKLFTFPSAVAQPQIAMEGFSGGQKVFVFDHGKYVFGHDALVPGSKQIEALDDDWLLKYMPGFVAAAASFGSVDLHKVDVLTTGLPINAWRKHKNELEAVLKTIKCNGETYTFDRVDVRPQGVGALGLHTSYGAPENEEGAVLDIGGNTGLFVGYKDLRPIATYTRQIQEFGVLSLAHSIAPQLSKMANGIMVTDIRAMKAVRDRKFRGVDISSMVNEATAMYAERVISDLRSTYKHIILELERLVIAGGGAYLVGDDLKKEYPNATVLDQPEYANVRGYVYLSSLQV